MDSAACLLLSFLLASLALPGYNFPLALVVVHTQLVLLAGLAREPTESYLARLCRYQTLL